MSETLEIDNNSAEETVVKVVRKRAPRKSLKSPEPLRYQITLRPINKAYIMDKRFRISFDLGTVVYVLKNKQEIKTDFVELMPIESNRTPELETYLKTEDKDFFTLQHSTSLFNQRDLDVVMLYDREDNVIHCQEYANSYI